MERIEFSSEFFNIKDTLECGQVFRFYPYEKGYVVISTDKCAYVYSEDDKTVIETEHKEYFYNYFDLQRNYKDIFDKACSFGVEFLSVSANLGKGVRILNQDAEETLYSFIISQNNNIPRIKLTIERLCKSLGKPVEFMGQTLYAFPTSKELSMQDEGFYKGLGFGYRDKFMVDVSRKVVGGIDLTTYKALSAKDLKTALIKFKGVGPKVADCVCLFGYGKTESFPVDTWIEKIYRENFNGSIKDRNKISDYFVERFGEYSGYIQQYMFYYKRSFENK